MATLHQKFRFMKAVVSCCVTYTVKRVGGGWVGGDKWGKISLMVLELRGNTVLQSLSLNCFYYTYSSGF